MPYMNLTFAAFLTLAVEDVHLPEWSRRSEVHRLLCVEVVGGCYNSLLRCIEKRKRWVGL
ncbi:hypothetical protein Hanom_Chr00s192555g01835471 [Helianthus anomalus]